LQRLATSTGSLSVKPIGSAHVNRQIKECKMSLFALKWVFILDTDYTINAKAHLRKDFTTGCAFEDRKGQRRLEVYPDGTVKVLASYSWDGCTPKYAIWDIAVGTPDGIPNHKTKKPKAYYASLLHDALYQFLDADLPFSRASVDRIFLEILTRDDFGPRGIYYAVVRFCGGVFRHFTRWKRSYRGRKVPL
jgi:hypothetical protein